MIPTTSSMILGYSYEAGTLSLHLRGGALYHYHNVPPALVQEFTDSGSLGKFFAEHIKGKFEFTKGSA